MVPDLDCSKKTWRPLTMLNAKTCSILRDSKEKYEPLEDLMCTLEHGHAFGESIFLGYADRQRFFNAVAFSDCTCLALSKYDYEYIINSKERKIF